MIDLRSDTVTRPTPEMYAAMAKAPLGDDVLGDDPTVRELEETAAAMLGHEVAVFVPSGTMGNQIALAVHCQRGDALIAEEEAHILYYEVGAPAVIAGALTITVRSDRGVMDPQEISRRFMQRSLHTPGTVLLCVENTHNRAGGTVVPLESMRAYRHLCDEKRMRFHLDGARVFNAAVKLGVNVRDITSLTDSVSVCLSKGLRSPVGSLLSGGRGFIDEARIWRKRLGGGMRQSGLLAACGLVSLTQMVDRLSEDHARARTLAERLSEMPGVSVDLETVQTNMVIARVDGDASTWVAELSRNGVAALPTSASTVRFVLHADIDDKSLQTAIDRLSEVAVAMSPKT